MIRFLNTATTWVMRIGGRIASIAALFGAWKASEHAEFIAYLALSLAFNLSADEAARELKGAR